MVKGYSDNHIPLDTAWSDIDYLDNYRDFTYDKKKFEKLPAFIDDLHKKNMHYVPIIDAGVAMRSQGGYKAYDSGVADDIFIKINEN
jgi:alpha-glucosidase (family GH31 glycosyl hydrolase)